MRSWGPDLETGYAELDREHRELLRRARLAIDAVHNGTPREVAVKLVDDFIDYANRHYSTEEGLMAAFGYPDMETHIGEHREMQGVLSTVGARYRFKGPSSLVTLLMQRVVRQWFNHHIKEHDKKMVAFLANQAKITEG